MLRARLPLVSFKATLGEPLYSARAIQACAFAKANSKFACPLSDQIHSGSLASVVYPLAPVGGLALAAPKYAHASCQASDFMDGSVG